VVGEDGAAVLEGVYVTAKKYLLLKYLRDVTHELQICTLDGKDTQQIDLPGKGATRGP
jgi:prolyl oligopeptidase PreP (S9A serine peptidase family)